MDFQKNDIYKEWVLTNGLGGYAGCSVLGRPNRTHQGLLIAALHPPVERYLVLANIREALASGAEFYGEKGLLDFTCDPDASVTYTYAAGPVELTKTISLKQGSNLCAIAYEIQNKGEADYLRITPMLSFRDHSENCSYQTIQEAFLSTEELSTTGPGFAAVGKARPDVRVVVKCSEGILAEAKRKYDRDLPLIIEQDNEVEGLETTYSPYDIVIPLEAGQKKHLSVICYVENSTGEASTMQVEADTAFEIARAEKERVEQLIKASGLKGDSFAETLVASADHFIAYRESTGLSTVLAGLPWFTDWGRDTMIAFTGLTLATKRYDIAGDILLTFAKYIHHGMVPNMFPDDGQAPLYNTADASLWYFYAVDQYLQYVNSQEAYAFIEKDIYPGLKEILSAYQKGTDFSIYMTEDGLLHAGGGLDQVTWMDVRVGEWVVTPRHGKPVEINALWYNALKVMEKLAKRFGEEELSQSCNKLATRTRQAFREKFWYEEGGYLYDVIDGDEEKDPSLRPNQIYAVSLPYTMLEPEQERSIVDTVERELYVGVGLRSLSRDHKDYHGIYLGSLPKRDAAYHQGTAWGFLLGGFITAYTKTHTSLPTEQGQKPKADGQLKEQLLAMLEPMRRHLLEENCLGGICEIFDGDSPHKGRGCYNQAWSVGEVLRCYVENIG